MKSSNSTSPFLHRGLIEGFYGTPYRHVDRLWWIEELGRLGMNRYLYAPKDDPLHRDEWRTPYPDEKIEEFRELVEAGERCSVCVGFAISPGVSMVYGARDDREQLRKKIDQFRSAGARLFCLALDDVPTQLLHDADQHRYSSLAEAHIDLAHHLRGWIGEDAMLWLIPTDYVGTEPTPYLEQLGSELAPDIEVAWTGRTVLSPEIRAEEARARADTLRRRLLIWDNVPVADGPMRAALHLSPYLGRDPELASVASGILLNGMVQPRASAIAVRSAAEYLEDPSDYDPEAAWERAAAAASEGVEEPFALFARAHRFGPTNSEDKDRELEELWRAVEQVLEQKRPERAALGALARGVAARLAVADELRARLLDRDLLAEIEPWIVSHHEETRRLAAATELLGTLAANRAPMVCLRELFRFEARLREPLPTEISYGPRRLLYPQLVSLDDDTARFGDDPVLFRDGMWIDGAVDFVEALAVERLRGERG
ncbi:MAG: hypothetical protein HKP27_14510 [Myxococcales bacterium]|nr:hypothetical protein [Myxococcales bacterium]